jgi:hypothetical protein
MVTSQPARVSRRMTGYFTQFKWIRGQSLAEIERRLGYRDARLTSKAALIYRFLRLLEIAEFEVRGTSIWTEQRWQLEVVPRRDAELTASRRITRILRYLRRTKSKSAWDWNRCRSRAVTCW